VAAGGWSLDWQLPVPSLRVESSSGASEDPDEDDLTPSSLRAVAVLRIKEEAAPAVFGLTVRGTLKDYYEQPGDYDYVEVGHDGSFRLTPALKLGYDASMKDMRYAQVDAKGLSKDWLAVKASTTASFTLARGTTLEASVAGRWQMAENAAKSQQAWTVTTGASARIGEWLLGARYRGAFRLPLGALSAVSASTEHTGVMTLEWDPNR
ncbi:MAG TPA: hypothetical protein VMM82_06795, partial [Spirochaetia bacterium]|nr:hypothetical protein [Spirochaetia bacterium]